MAGEADAAVLLCLAFLFPPAAVAFLSGCGVDLCINILLTIIGWLPGCIHAFWLVLKRTEANERYGYGNWTYKGMGTYFARTEAPVSRYDQAPPQSQTAPSSEQYPPAKSREMNQQPSPLDQKQADHAPPPPPPTSPVETKSTGYPGPPAEPAPVDQKTVEVAPQTADQKQAETTPQTTVPPK